MNIHKKIYINIFIVISLIIFFCFFLIYPNSKAIKKGFDEILQKKDNLLILDKKKEYQKRIKESYIKHKKDLDSFQNLFVDPNFPVDLINFLENSALNSGVELEISSLAKTEKNDDLWPGLLINLSLNGSPSGFLRFLEKIESAPYLVKIITFAINSKESLITIKVFSK